MSKSDQSKSLRVYRLLLQLYPRNFRHEYGSEMQRLFADQLQEGFTGLVLVRFWMRVLIDLVKSVSMQHLLNLKQSSPMTSLWRNPSEISFSKWFACVAVCLMTLCVAITYLQPRIYSSTARFELGGTNQNTPNPYAVQTMFEQLMSEKILTTVASELNLSEHFTKMFGAPIPQDLVVVMLPSMIEMRQSRNTSLVELRVYTKDKALSAQIANKLSQVFQREYPSHRVNLIDSAIPSTRPIRPNVPLNMVLGIVISLAAGLAIAGIIRLAFRMRAPLPHN